SLLFSTPPATSEPYSLSLHDALPISTPTPPRKGEGLSDALPHAHAGSKPRTLFAVAAKPAHGHPRKPLRDPLPGAHRGKPLPRRSEEHTSELQSRENLVCRLLLEKKK